MPDKINLKLSEKLESPNLKLREQGRKEQILYNHSNHKAGLFTVKSVITGELMPLYIRRGQYFTTRKRLAILLGCNIRQLRYQLKKWVTEGIIEVNRIKDSKNYDLGLLITYKHLFNLANQKIVPRESNQKTHKNNKKDYLTKKIVPLNKEVLSKDNILKKTTKKKILNDQRQVVFSFNKDKEFLEISKKLKALGFSNLRIENFYLNYSKENLEKYLTLLELNKTKIKMPCAWFTQALKQQFDLTQVENWKKKEKEKEELIKFQELEKIKIKESQEAEKKRLLDENKLIEIWKLKNGEHIENQIYLKTFEELKTKNRIIYNCILKKINQQKCLIETLKKDCFLKAQVRNKILKQISLSEFNFTNHTPISQLNLQAPSALPHTLRQDFAEQPVRA